MSVTANYMGARDSGWDVHIDPKFPGRGYGIQFYRFDGRMTHIISGFETKSFDLDVEPEPSAAIGMSAAQMQHLIDALWNVGFRPTEGSGSAGSLAATQDHLKTVQDVMNRALILVEKRWGK